MRHSHPQSDGLPPYVECEHGANDAVTRDVWRAFRDLQLLSDLRLLRDWRLFCDSQLLGDLRLFCDLQLLGDLRSASEGWVSAVEGFGPLGPTVGLGGCSPQIRRHAVPQVAVVQDSRFCASATRPPGIRRGTKECTAASPAEPSAVGRPILLRLVIRNAPWRPRFAVQDCPPQVLHSGVSIVLLDTPDVQAGCGHGSMSPRNFLRGRTPLTCAL